MSNETLFSLTLREAGLVFLWILFFLLVYSSIKSIIDNDLYNYDRKYRPVIVGLLLPIMLFIKFILDCMFDGISSAYMNFINNSVNLVFIITIYYLLIFILLKILRQYLHPLVVSTLWLLPNLLYIFVYQERILFKGLYVLEISPIIYYVLGGIWLLGFIFVLTYKIIEHFKFRNEILKDSFEINDKHVKHLLQTELNKIKFNKQTIRLMQSNQIISPLTIGIIDQIIVLPHIDYTDEELVLIFKHEMIHIGRQDVYIKFHIVFCNALCWFNPMMWLANKKCSEDIELSCDSSVLALEDSSIRKQYARLILKNTNCEKGFTTCLSSSAKSLRYRLQNIIEPKNKKTGLLVLFIATFLLVFSFGNVIIAVQGYYGKEELFENHEVTLSEVIRMNTIEKYEVASYENEDQIIDYLINLKLSKMPFSEIEDNKDEKYLWLIFNHDSGFYRIMIHDHYIEVDDDIIKASNKYYYVKEGIDMEYLNELFVYYPSLKISLFQFEQELDAFWPTLKEVSIDDKIIYKTNDQTINHLSNNHTQFKVEFYDEVISDIEVIETINDRFNKIIIHKNDEYLVKINKDATYTIKTTINKDGYIYNVTYEFNLDV